MIYTGSEHFSLNGKEIDVTINDFWRWTYSGILDSEKRNSLAKFIVYSSISAMSLCDQGFSDPRKNYDVMTEDGFRVKVESSSYLQSFDGNHPDCVSFPLSGMQDAYVFCLYKALSPSQNPIDLDLWDFFAISSKEILHDNPQRRSITLPRLEELGIWQSDYFGIPEAIRRALDA